MSQHRSLWAAGCAAGVHKRRLRAGAKADLRTHTLRIHSRLHFEIGDPSPQEEGREWVDGSGRPPPFGSGRAQVKLEKCLPIFGRLLLGLRTPPPEGSPLSWVGGKAGGWLGPDRGLPRGLRRQPDPPSPRSGKTNFPDFLNYAKHIPQPHALHLSSRPSAKSRGPSRGQPPGSFHRTTSFGPLTFSCQLGLHKTPLQLPTSAGDNFSAGRNPRKV